MLKGINKIKQKHHNLNMHNQRETRSEREFIHKIYSGYVTYAYAHSSKQETPSHLLWKSIILFSWTGREETLNTRLIRWSFTKCSGYKQWVVFLKDSNSQYKLSIKLFIVQE